MFLEAYEQIKDKLVLPKIADLKDRYNVNKKYGAESIIDKGVFGATGFLASKSPLLATVSPIIFDILKQRADDRRGANEALKDPTFSGLKEKYGKGTNKAVVSAARQIDRLKRKDPEGYKNSEVFKEFGSIYEKLRQSDEKTTEREISTSGSGAENTELLQRIAENTDSLRKSEEKDEKPKVDAEKKQLSADTEKSIAAVMEKKKFIGSPVSTSTAIVKSSNSLITQGASAVSRPMPVPPLMVKMLQRAGVPVAGAAIAGAAAARPDMEADENRKEQERTIVQESNETQALLADIKESTEKAEKKEDPSLISKLLDGVKSSLGTAITGALSGIGGGILSKIPGIGGDKAPEIDLDVNKPNTTVPDKKGGGGLFKRIAKGAGKSVLKKIPVIGALAGLGFAGQKLLEGDLTGAGLEAASGLAGAIPGIGTAASIGIDAAIAAREESMAKPAESVKEAQPDIRPKVEPAPTTIQNSKVFQNSGVTIAGVPVTPSSELTEKQIQEINTSLSASPNTQFPSYVLDKYEAQKETSQDVLARIDAVSTADNTRITDASVPQVRAATQRIQDILDQSKRTDIERENTMMESAKAPVVINNTNNNMAGNGNKNVPNMPVRPGVRNQEPTFTRLHEKEYWGRAK